MANFERLNSILAQFPGVERALELGCGACPALAGAVALDRDAAALLKARSQPNSRLVQADITRLPFRARFGLVLARHPDIDRSRGAWRTALLCVPAYLETGGVLIVTTYSLPEIETIRRWAIPLTPLPLAEDKLIGPDLVGHDRFVMCWQKRLRSE